MSNSILILTGSDINNLLAEQSTITSALDSQTKAFIAYSNRSNVDAPATITSTTTTSSSDVKPPARIQAPLRTTLTSERVTTLVMPARADASFGLGGIGIKVVSVPNQGDAGLPATTTIFDETTGNLRAVINARALTALRNACGSTRYLQTALAGTPDATPTSLLLFGSGAQIRAHALLIQSAFPTIKEVTIVNRRRTSRLEELAASLEREYERRTTGTPQDKDKVRITVGAADEDGFDLTRAVSMADIIVCATPSTTPLFPSSSIIAPPIDEKTSERKKKTIVLIGSYKPHMLEISRDMVQRALVDGGKVIVDSREACLTEAGELQEVGPDDVVELGELLSRRGLESTDVGTGEVRIYKSVGIAVQDVAIANTMIEAAQRCNVGTIIDDWE